MATKDLTAKQESFAQAVVDGLNQSDAYRQAYSAGNMKPEAVWVEASRLMDNPTVSLRVKELSSAVVDDFVAKKAWDLGRIVDEFEVNLDLGRIPNDKGSYTGLAASNAAITGIGKAIGILTDKVDINVTHTLKPGLTLEELEARVQRLDALEAGVVDGESKLVDEIPL